MDSGHLRALAQRSWSKLICGASYQDTASIEPLSWVFTLAGVNCIDVAADPAVVQAAHRGIQRAGTSPPWVMVSLNDDTDPHFRKAYFDPQLCPPECPRPCERVCPVQAISAAGVAVPSCYGCGRCLDICPYNYITAHTYVHRPAAVIELLQNQPISALEIHTQVGHGASFQHLWRELQPWINRLQVLAISCQDHEGVIPYLWNLYKIITKATPLPYALIWQADGRPMSGDIGAGTTQATVRLAQKILAQGPPGFVQLAGGTNQATWPLVQKLNLPIHGVAYGSYARKLLQPYLQRLDDDQILAQAVAQARDLIAPKKPDGAGWASGAAPGLTVPG
ncbi:4Fe-4S ferredoxin, iron-sulfur binding protein [Gloeomargarita lithophora Alchichica-D10]|uniref:4Fe-4S ferredoxin, iron-sulfur binding protein n=1 Tax=Gloeomargarita lithophora Alchichica-D10 TaxID=1188229 RepID=A0A1J0ACM7_9CYAN|nr:LdpA C-terminal domain-containing domain [Gloeomargarita lithophora]APB33692.1 4Fe-4S ferredoxin, iron-sulfur binding protein [Gloeomargarita lithophora Alchichica-D10]